MLAEVLLVLSGHPSSFFVPRPHENPTTLAVAPSLASHLHPGEAAALNTLGRLAYQYTAVRDWARDIQKRGRQAVLSASLGSSSRSTQSHRDDKDKSKGKGKEREEVHGREVDLYLSTMAGGILDVLHEYETLIVETESRILDLDEGLVQDSRSYVPLSTLVATFSPWHAPFAALSELIRSIPPTPGLTIHHLSNLCNNGNPRLYQIFTTLLSSLNHLFLTHLCLFVLSGIAPTASTATSPAIGLDAGPDPLSPQYRIYKLNEDLIPPTVRPETRESILYVGRVTATLKREGRVLPTSLVESLRQSIMRPDMECRHGGRGEGGGSRDHQGDLESLDSAISKARQEVGEWLWTHILTSTQVSETIESFSNYFFTRQGDFAISVLREIHTLERTTLLGTNPHSSSAVIREQDVNTAILRASVGTSAELDKNVERLRYRLPLGSIRPLSLNLPRQTAAPASSGTTKAGSGDGIRGLFSSFLLGSPAILGSNITWPLDLFMTPATMTAYSDIHTFLMAIRDTHMKVLGCWSSLSASQRRRRKWTGANEGGQTKADKITRRRLARTAWGTIRAMLFFLDELLGHFMTDVIDVQHRKLLVQLAEVDEDVKATMGSAVPTTGSGLDGRAGSMKGSTRPTSPTSRFRTPTRTFGGHESMGGSTRGGDTQTVRSRIPPGSKQQKKFLDFVSLRQIHSRHLAFIREGLLISDQATAVIIRDILEVCRRFTGLVERWGGDVLPELLSDEVTGERESAVEELAENLNDLLSDFFRILVDSQNPAAAGETSGSTSISRTSRATQIMQIQSSRVLSRQVGSTSGINKTASFGRSEGLDDALSGKHIEQLLLRLDFNGVLTSWRQREEEGQIAKSVLAEGGL